MAFDEDWLTKPDGTVQVALVDSETTGLNPEVSEVIGLNVLCVRVDRLTGRVLDVVGSALEWQEPESYSEEAQAITQVPISSLAGRRFDWAKIDALLAQTDLVVAHNAAFEWAFLTPLFPALAKVRWACSLDDIDWRGEHKLAQPSIDVLLKAYALGQGDGSPADDCDALVKILSQLLPESSETGFFRLIVASARVTVACEVLENEQAARGLQALGFERRDGRWEAVAEDAAAALALEEKVIDLAAHNPAFAQLQICRIDAVNRFGTIDDEGPTR